MSLGEVVVSPWNLFNRNKDKKKNNQIDHISDTNIIEKTDYKNNESSEKESNSGSEKSYREVLYTKEVAAKYTADSSDKTDKWCRRSWESSEDIEEHVDSLDKMKQRRFAQVASSGVDTKVDEILSRQQVDRKPSNVIYVVSDPQPGQVRGDWAVRAHKKVLSHHRVKENAVKEARRIARKVHATVMVQNTDGTFSNGFKPHPKK